MAHNRSAPETRSETSIMDITDLKEHLEDWTISEIRFPDDHRQQGIELKLKIGKMEKTVYLTPRDCGLYIEPPFDKEMVASVDCEHNYVINGDWREAAECTKCGKVIN